MPRDTASLLQQCEDHERSPQGFPQDHRTPTRGDPQQLHNQARPWGR
jgi:hypothetical protein